MSVICVKTLESLPHSPNKDKIGKMLRLSELGNGQMGVYYTIPSALLHVLKWSQ